MITSIFGSGIDIFTFCLLTLHYRISEKVATPTSVVLMTINTIFGFLLHVFIIKDFEETAFNYWLVSIPVVVIFAPMGALFISKRSREFVARLLYFIICAQFLGAVIILKPDLNLALFSLITFLLGSIFFYLISQNRGRYRIKELLVKKRSIRKTNGQTNPSKRYKGRLRKLQ